MTLNVEALNEVGRLFDWQPDPARYFATHAAEHVRQGLHSSLTTGDGVLVLVGEAGAGKTLLVRTVLQELPAHWAHVAQLSFTAMSGDEIASAIAYAFGMPPGPSVMSHQPPLQWTQTQLRVWASCGEASLLVVDEAQSLPPDALHTLLALAQLRQNERPVLRVLLVGQAGLTQRLENAPLISHASTPFVVPALTRAESAAYLRSRLAHYTGPALPELTPSAITEIYARTQGLPGRINMLCQQLLHTAILLESYTAIDAGDVAIQADELGYHALPEAAPPSIFTAPSVPVATPVAPMLKTGVPATVAPTSTASPAAPSHNVPTPQTDALAERHHPAPPPPKTRRIACLSASAVVVAVLAAGTWYYANRPTATPVASIKAPVQAPIEVPTIPVAAPALTTPTEAAPEAQPATADTRAQPPASAIPAPAPAPAPSTELPPAPPVDEHTTAPIPTPAPAPKSKPAPTAVESHAVSAAAKPGGHQANCTSLLTQMSLGEPLTPAQRRFLESQCR